MPLFHNRVSLDNVKQHSFFGKLWLLSFLALSQEMVSIVAPILQTELLFILFFAYIFLRKIEKISLKLIASALLIVIGVILISIN